MFFCGGGPGRGPVVVAEDEAVVVPRAAAVAAGVGGLGAEVLGTAIKKE